MTTKTEDKAVLVDNKQLQGSSTFDFNWVFKKATFTGTLALQKYQSAKPSKNLFKFLIWKDLFKCPKIHLRKVLDKWSGIDPCDMNLKVSGHMYPGSGLQTEIECSDSGLPPYLVILRQFRLEVLMLFLGIFFVYCWCSFFIESFCTMELVLVESADALLGIFLSISGWCSFYWL